MNLYMCICMCVLCCVVCCITMNPELSAFIKVFINSDISLLWHRIVRSHRRSPVCNHYHCLNI